MSEAGENREGFKRPNPREELRDIRSNIIKSQPYRLMVTRESDSEEFFQLRCANARMQQRLARMVVGVVGAGGTRKDRYYALCLLREFWTILGSWALNNPKLKDCDVNQYLEEQKRGVKGMIAVWIMAKQAGFQVILPDVTHDVKSGVDLIIEKGERRIPLTIECKKNGEWHVEKETESPLVAVTIPDRRGSSTKGFFLDYELGVPHKSRYEDFVNCLKNQGLIT